MIRKNSLFCKLIRIKSSSKFLFDSFMAGFLPEKETCACCGASHTCHFHASYERNLIDYISGRTVYHTVCICRVISSGCGHIHAILWDLIIPYSTYGLFFILQVIAEYLIGRYTIEQLCSRFDISHSMLYRWYSLFLSHKQEWHGVLTSAETSSFSFLKSLCRILGFSAFALHTSDSFLQSHRNPAPDRQTVF